MEQTTLATNPLLPPGSDPAAQPDLTGRAVGDFQILRRLGQGGMGQVYLAEQVSLKRKVALKVLRPELASNPTSLARFKAEAEAVARATHANIVQVYYIGAVDGLPFMALEYVEGRNLREYLAKKGPPELALALSIMRQVAAALTRAGELGIVHRDVKPDNILLTRKGEVKVADFGLSRVQTEGVGPHLTQSGVTMGTPLYMAPEQAEGKAVDCRTDIYSFGVTCFHMLAGEPPYRGATALEIALQHVRGAPPPLADFRPDLPPALAAMVHKMMARDPAQRYQTARELLREIGKLRDGMSGTAAVVPIPEVSVELLPVEAPAEDGTPRVLIDPSSLGATGRLLHTQRSWPRWQVATAFALSLLLALGAGAAVARWRKPSAVAPPNGSPPDAVDVESLLPLHDDEAALRKTAEMYLASGAGRDVSTGMALCSKLGTMYLDKYKLDDADRLFARLDNCKDVRPYHTLGHLGRGIVLALRDQAKESNKLFREVAIGAWPRDGLNPKGEVKRPDPEMAKVWQNPAFVYWMAQAVRYNKKNGILDAEAPPALLKLLDLKGRP